VGATWVGITGTGSHDLLQAGTQDVGSGSRQSQYQAWIELLAHAAQQVPLAVAPGDSVSVSITEQGADSGIWQISMKNNTSGHQLPDDGPVHLEPVLGGVDRRGAGQSQQHGAARQLRLRHAQRGRRYPERPHGRPGPGGAQPITMLNAASQPLTVPSAIGSDGSSFGVTRTSASAVTGNGRGFGRGLRGGVPGPGR
jgi:Peptidase A4 family